MKKNAAGAALDEAQMVMAAEKAALEPFSHTGESPYAIHRDLQTVMQSLVGIYRTAEDLERAQTELQIQLKARAALASVEGTRLFKSGLALVAGFELDVDCFGCGDEERAGEDGKPRGA